MEFYWLTSEEYTYGFFSTFNKAVKCAEEDYAEHVGYDKSDFQRPMFVRGNTLQHWSWMEYHIYKIEQLDEKLF